MMPTHVALVVFISNMLGQSNYNVGVFNTMEACEAARVVFEKNASGGGQKYFCLDKVVSIK